jgi:hypothetical protein
MVSVRELAHRRMTSEEGGTCDYVVLHSKRDFEYVIKLKISR